MNATAPARRWLLVLAAGLLLSLVIAACGTDDMTAEDSEVAEEPAEPEADTGNGNGTEAEEPLEAARERGFIRAGFANEAPYGFVDDEGNLTGQAPEVARAVFERLDVEEVDGVPTEFGSLIPGLQAERFDFIAAGMFITPDRCQEIIFSDPDYCATQAFAVESGNPQGLESYEDVADNPDVALGVLQGAVEEGYALDLGVSEDQLSTFPDPPSMMEGLQAGRVDAIALTSISIRDLIDTFGDGDVELAGPFIPVIDGEEQLGCGGFGFREENTELRDAFNEEVRQMMEDGEVVEIVEPFGFGEEEVEAALGTTAEEQCEAPEE